MSIWYYNDNAEKFFNDTHKLDMQDIYNKFIPHLPKGGKILDAGCGSGRDIKKFSELGYDAIGFDASKDMVKRANSLTNGKVLHLHFEEINWINEFDGIWACASLLHVPEKNFKSVGTKLYKSLKINCPFYLSFKYGYREYVKDNRFFQCHDEKSLENLMKSIGSFSKQEFWQTTDIRPDRKKEKWLNAIYIK